MSQLTLSALLLPNTTSSGPEGFLARYGFRPARKFLLLHDGRTYDSKAILGAAHQHATGRPLPAATFNGGEQTVTRLAALGFDVRDSAVSSPSVGTIGEIPGVEVGTTFATRREASEAGVHRALQAGIVGTGASGAESIVVLGGYEDDVDNGWEIIYTGHGGRDGSGRQVSAQSFESPGNAALQTSLLTGAPVRGAWSAPRLGVCAALGVSLRRAVRGGEGVAGARAQRPSHLPVPDG